MLACHVCSASSHIRAYTTPLCTTPQINYSVKYIRRIPSEPISTLACLPMYVRTYSYYIKCSLGPLRHERFHFMLFYTVAENWSTVHQKSSVDHWVWCLLRKCYYVFITQWSLSVVTMQQGVRYAPHQHLTELVHNKKLNATISFCVCLFIMCV